MKKDSGFTIEALKKSAVANLNPHLFEEQPKIESKLPRKPRKDSKAKKDINSWLWAWCREKGLELKLEQEFHPARKWRFDWQIPKLMIGIEYNGIMSDKSRHTTVVGYTGDMEKINAAQSLGWTVLQYTPLNYKSLISDVEKIFDKLFGK